MSYAIGMKIKQLREKSDITQLQMAELLKTTRQRYARLENGQLDISFVMIKKIADILCVSTREITDVEDEKKALTVLFRENSNSEEAVKSVEVIEQILAVFHAHEKLYYQMKVSDSIEV